MGWWIALGVLVLLAILPLGGRVHYNSQGVRAWILAGPIRIGVYPLKKKEKKKPKKKPEKEPDTPAPAQEAKKEPPLPEPPKPPKPDKKKETGGSLLDFLPLVRLGLNLLGDFRRKIRVNNLYVRLVLASSDPADLGIQYGRVWAALGNLMPRVERIVKIKKRDIQVGCDFEASQTVIVCHLDLTITLGRLIALGVCYGIRALKELLILKKKRKGGAYHEPETT